MAEHQRNDRKKISPHISQHLQKKKKSLVVKTSPKHCGWK